MKHERVSEDRYKLAVWSVKPHPLYSSRTYAERTRRASRLNKWSPLQTKNKGNTQLFRFWTEGKWINFRYSKLIPINITLDSYNCLSSLTVLMPAAALWALYDCSSGRILWTWPRRRKSKFAWREDREEMIRQNSKYSNTCGPVHSTPEEFENGDFTLKTYQMFPVYTKPEEFENGDFTLKTNQMFSVHTTLQEFGNGLSLWKRIKCFPSTLRRRNL